MILISLLKYILSSPSFDHCSLINTYNYSCGPSPWKFNNSLIEKMCFLKHRKTHFNDTKSNFEENLSDQSECEFLKYQIRNFTPFSLDS